MKDNEVERKGQIKFVWGGASAPWAASAGLGRSVECGERLGHLWEEPLENMTPTLA